LSREECAQRRGNCLRRTVAARKPEAQPCPCQDSQRTKDATGRTDPNGAMAGSALRMKASPARALMPARSDPQRQAGMSSASSGGRLEACCGFVMAKAVGHVGEQAGVTARTAHRQRRGRHAFAQPSAAKSGVAPRTAHRGGALWKPGPLAGADCRTAHKAFVRRHVAA